MKWRHWLEWATHLSLQITTIWRKNQLNPHQDRSVLFLQDLTALSYYLGSKNTKVDSLSCIYSILKKWPAHPCIIHLWPALQGSPTYLPMLEPKLITRANTRPANWHPGTSGTLELLHAKYWWPNIQTYIHTLYRVLSSCPICAQAKVPCMHPSHWEIHTAHPPLPMVPHSFRLFTDLPSSKGNYTILVILDCFPLSIPIHRLLPPLMHGSEGAKWCGTHQHLEQAAAVNKRSTYRQKNKAPQYNPRDKIKLATKNHRSSPENKKLSARYIGA